MSFETVGSLRNFLQEKSWSCEVLATHVAVSNMTWRRLLAKPDATPLPVKYRMLLGQALEADVGDGHPAESLDPLSIVLSGTGQTEDQVLFGLAKEGGKLHLNAHAKRLALKARHTVATPRRIHNLLRDLRRIFPLVGRGSQALILGGLVYFLNPFDLIADSVLSVGLLDDLGILLLIRSRLKAVVTSVPT